MHLSPVPAGGPALPEGVWGCPWQGRKTRKSGVGGLPSGTPCPNRQRSLADFDYEDLQPGVSFLGNTVRRLYEQRLRAFCTWEGNRQEQEWGDALSLQEAQRLW